MKLQKVMAGTLAMALVLTANGMPVSAAQANKTGNLTVEGDTTYVDTTIYKVTLPTSSSLNFTLDPEGLVGFFADTANASATTAENADLTNYKGKIVGSGSETIVNESSIPIQLTCKYYLTNADGVTVAANKDEWDDTRKMILLEAIAAKKSDADATGYAPTALATPAVDTTNSVIAISSVNPAAPSSISFALAAAPYEFKKGDDGSFTYVPKDGATLGDTQHAVVSLAGFVSSAADWTALSEAQSGSKLTLNCVYSIKGLSLIDSGATNTDNVVIDASKLTISNDGLKDGDTITARKGDTDLSFQVKLPEGATAIGDIGFLYGGKTYVIEKTVEGNEIIVNTAGKNAKYLLNTAPAGTYPVKIGFVGTSTIYTISLITSDPTQGLQNGDSFSTTKGDSSLQLTIALPAGATAVNSMSFTLANKSYNMPISSASGGDVVIDTTNKDVAYMLNTAAAGTYDVTVSFNGSAATYTLKWIVS